MSDDFRCVLADFGISLMMETQVPATTTLRRGTIRWLPPEMIDTSLYQPEYLAARDIYSFGCTVIEVSGLYSGETMSLNLYTVDLHGESAVLAHPNGSRCDARSSNPEADRPSVFRAGVSVEQTLESL